MASTRPEILRQAGGGERDQLEMGTRGFLVVTNGTSIASGTKFWKIHTITAATVSVTNEAGGDDPSSLALPANFVMYGHFADDLAVGSSQFVLAYLI